MSSILPILLAPFIGSFLGVLIRRIPAGRQIAFGRSVCESCCHVLAPVDLVPLVSFALQRGRCRYCGSPISPSHLAIELAALGIAIVAVATESVAGGDAGRVWVDCAFGWVLLALSWIDAEHFLLPDVLTLPLLPAGLAWIYLTNSADLVRHVAAAVVGYLAFRLIAFGYRAWRGFAGIGAGDAKLIAAIGAWVGLNGLGPVILVAALLGLAMAFVMRLRGAAVATDTKLPFGACLGAAAWIVFLSA